MRNAKWGNGIAKWGNISWLLPDLLLYGMTKYTNDIYNYVVFLHHCHIYRSCRQVCHNPLETIVLGHLRDISESVIETPSGHYRDIIFIYYKDYTPIDMMNEWELKEYLDEHCLDMDEFFQWITGQTVAMDDDGNFLYFKNDVDYWVSCKLDGRRPIIFD